MKEELDILFPPEPENKEKAPMKLGIFKIIALSMLAGSVLTMTASHFVSKYEGDPLRELYASMPDIYGPDMVILYDAQKKYCQPPIWQVLLGAHDQAVCLYTIKEEREYISLTEAALKMYGTAKNVKSDSVHVLVATQNSNLEGLKLMDKKKEVLQASTMKGGV